MKKESSVYTDKEIAFMVGINTDSVLLDKDWLQSEEMTKKEFVIWLDRSKNLFDKVIDEVKKLTESKNVTLLAMNDNGNEAVPIAEIINEESFQVKQKVPDISVSFICLFDGSALVDYCRVTEAFSKAMGDTLKAIFAIGGGLLLTYEGRFLIQSSQTEGFRKGMESNEDVDELLKID